MTLHRQPDDPGTDPQDLAEFLSARYAEARLERRFWRILWILFAIGIAMLIWAASADAALYWRAG